MSTIPTCRHNISPEDCAVPECREIAKLRRALAALREDIEEAQALLRRLENEIENMSIWANSARDRDLKREIETYLKEKG